MFCRRPPAGPGVSARVRLGKRESRHETVLRWPDVGARGHAAAADGAARKDQRHGSRPFDRARRQPGTCNDQQGPNPRNWRGAGAARPDGRDLHSRRDGCEVVSACSVGDSLIVYPTWVGKRGLCRGIRLRTPDDLAQLPAERSGVEADLVGDRFD
jgi:hypothetical protein